MASVDVAIELSLAKRLHNQQQLARVDLVFGAGQRVFGNVFFDGEEKGGAMHVSVRRQRNSKLVGAENPILFFVVWKSELGHAFVDERGRFEVNDIPPGTYLLQLERVPEVQDNSSWQQAVMEPLYRAEITVGEEPLHHDVRIGARNEE